MNMAQAIQILEHCAGEYQKNLENKNVMFVFRNDRKQLEFLETTFHAKHFLHLTGIDILPNRIRSAQEFYKACLNGKLLKSDFIMEKRTTEKKLNILSNTMKLHLKARMVGDYNFSRVKLMTDKLAGHSTACMGFRRDDEQYVPNTNLEEDVRNLTVKPFRIFVIFRKDISEPLYNEVCHVTNGVVYDEFKLPNIVVAKLHENILPKIDLQQTDYFEEA